MSRLLTFAVLVAALVFAGCGDKHDYNLAAETEGEYVDVGNLVYQVQMSRFLNPGDREDREYLEGLPAGTPPPTADETWFGVWMRVKNYTNETLQMAEDFVGRSTPRRIASSRSRWTTRSRTRPSRSAPTRSTRSRTRPPSSGPIQGSLILFKLTNDSLQNRPLKLEIEQEGFETAEIDLDL